MERFYFVDSWIKKKRKKWFQNGILTIVANKKKIQFNNDHDDDYENWWWGKINDGFFSKHHTMFHWMENKNCDFNIEKKFFIKQ